MTNSYHSILIETSSQKGGVNHQELAEACLEKIESPAKIKAIFLNTDGESFKISQARGLKSQAQYAKANNEPMAFVICHAEKITIPAQNALLKLLEEPPANTILVLVASTDHQLLPTVKSRCKIEIVEKLAENPDSSPDTEEVSELISFFQNPDSVSYSDLINLSEKLKDRVDATKTLMKVLLSLQGSFGTLKHPEIPLEKQPNPKLKNTKSFSGLEIKLLANSLKLITTALDSLQKNGNVRLVLEDCFFTFKKTSK